jgi:tRNA (guanine-N7-)-methyltransferase
MGRALKYDIPGTDWRVAEQALAERGVAGIFQPELAPPFELEVDLGFGRGEFVLERAAGAPRVAFLGVEYSSKRVLKLARRLARTPLANVRLVEATAERVVGELLPEACIARAWINFPDPWPKKRHHRRRMLNPAFARALTSRLRPGGELHVATDHAEYAAWIDEVLAAEPGLENLFAPDRFRGGVAGRAPTAYELAWRAEGRSFHFFAYARRRP